MSLDLFLADRKICPNYNVFEWIRQDIRFTGLGETPYRNVTHVEDYDEKRFDFLLP